MRRFFKNGVCLHIAQNAEEAEEALVGRVGPLMHDGIRSGCPQVSMKEQFQR